MKDLINAIIQSLNKVEVKGEDNMDYLLGSIMALKQIVSKLDEVEKAREESDEVESDEEESDEEESGEEECEEIIDE